MIRSSSIGPAVGPSLLLGEFASPENLAPGQSYQRTQDFTLPQGISGNYQIIVTTGVGSSFYDINPAANTDQQPAFPVQLTPSPDLQVTAITVPPTATDGQQATFSWTVTNNGTGATNSPTWEDTVYLSRDQTLSPDDILIGTAQNPSATGAGRVLHPVANREHSRQSHRPVLRHRGRRLQRRSGGVPLQQ